MTSSARRSPRPLIAVHWITLILMIAVYALIELREFYPKGSPPREAMKTWHNMVGLLILAVVAVRIVVRFRRQLPPIQPTPPIWQRYLAEAMHLTLYGFLVVMPILGWLTLSAKGKVVPFFGVELPALLGPDKSLVDQLEGIHKVIGNLGYFLIAGHAGAALFHHYLLRDNALIRMLRLSSAGNTGDHAAVAATGRD